MDTLSNSRLDLSILHANQACFDMIKLVPLEDNDGFLLRLTVYSGFLPSFQGSEVDNGYFVELPTCPKHS